MAKSTYQKIAENYALMARTNLGFERLDFPQLVTLARQARATDVPNRLYGASINEDGDAV